MSEWAQYVRPQLARLRLEGSRESEIIEELSQHLDQRFDELRREGFSEARARQLAVDELVEPVALGTQMTPLRQASQWLPPTLGAPGASWLGDLWQDLRYGLRMIRKQPLFATAVIFTLALGIGANSAIFALVDATLLRPLPLPDPGQLVLAWDKTAATPRGRVAALNMLDWAERSRTVESIGALVPNVGGMVMGNAGGLPDTVSRQWVTSGIFSTLGITPIAGRTFTREDDVQRRNAVVLSEAIWRERFNADTRVVGREVRLDGEPYTVVGVVGKEAQIVGRSSIWALIPITGAPPRSRGGRSLVAVARLRPGVSLDAAQSDLDAVAAGLAREFPDTNANRGVGLEPLHEVVLGTELRQTSVLFIGVVGLVLLICCANVANLLLTRATVRQRELAVRAALGADRRRVIRQLLTESLLLSCLGGGLGLLVGGAILRAAPSMVPPELLPAVVTLAVDLRVVAFCAVTAVIVGLLFGLAPAWQATSPAAAQSMAGSRTITGRGGRVRDLLVMAQVATAVVLLFGAGLLLRTLLAVEGVDRGYRAGQVLSMVLDPMSSAYPTDAAELQFYQAVEQEIRALPGVAGVAWATTLPLGRSYEGDSPFEVEGAAIPPDGQRPSADMQIVSPSYFDTLRVPVVSGRAFDHRDVAGALPVCMVNEAFVRRHFQGASPIGRRLVIRDSDGPQAATTVREIVGVVRQIKGSPTETEEFVQLYVPMAQDTPGDVFLLVTPAAGRADALTLPVRGAIGRIDKAQLVSVRGIMTLDEVVADANARHRFRAVLVVAFAALSLVLAMVGLFSILAYSVQQRIRDFGVRRALGASTGHVMALVAGNAFWVIGLGAVAGLALSYLVGRLLATMLFGVRPSDPLTFALVAVVMTLGAMLSTIGPAWRAARIEPASALRRE